ncbi:hypothetical protein BACCAP_00003 [Pseudoflavonifractor capillosus ATCC 29799]|uniref:Uncharacterized protein n=1 Tax=Pseudoflavonifractor capillosus ATCC 29799 TaxID=411467 RepID=A6NPB2_9FIRM|nr:hypothetical protein BACCAP_00003 [Pseudoflavonifractor capillosus ATCC 29799]
MQTLFSIFIDLEKIYVDLHILPCYINVITKMDIYGN